MRVGFQSPSCRFASQILRSIPSGIHFCKSGTRGPATRPPFPNVRSSYLFRESAWLPFHTLQEAQWQESDVSAARYSPVPDAPESGFPAGAIPRCVQACSFRRLHNPPHLEARRFPRCPARSRKFARIPSYSGPSSLFQPNCTTDRSSPMLLSIPILLRSWFSDASFIASASTCSSEILLPPSLLYSCTIRPLNYFPSACLLDDRD